MTGPFTVIVVDDHTLFRQAVAQMIDSEADLEVVGQGCSGDDAVELAGRLKPDIALVDVEMPGPAPAETVRKIRELAPATRIAILTMHDESDMIRSLLGSGASAYLAKNVAREQLLSALRSVCTDQSAHIAVSRQSLLMATESAPGRPTLTQRETEVIRCVAMAMSNQQIASRLYISEGTVKRHLTNIFAKLEAVSRLDAVRKAHAARLLGMKDFD